MPDERVRWVGMLVEDELLWPQVLPEGEVIDLGAVTAVGSWVHGWFRARPGQAVVHAHPEVRRQLEDAGLAILFRDPSPGLTADERAALLDPPA